MTLGISNAIDQTQSSDRQFGFVSTLHPDIIFSICSYLDQRDCLTCMSVCRTWYEIIPEYVQHAWTTIRLTAHNAQMESKRWIRCLGAHVKRVILDKYSDEQCLYYTMHKLLDWGCTEIEYLELNECQTTDQDAFLDALAKFGSHLTQLRILCHESNVAFLHMFNACPELTHFTFNASISAWWRYSVYDKEPVITGKQGTPPSDLKTKITHLYLDTYMAKESRIYSILKSCPDLRSLVGPSTHTLEIDHATQDWQYNDVAIDLDKLFEFCPKVNYVRNFFTYNALDDIWDIDAYTSDQRCTGLRYLDICEDYGCDRIAQCLSENQSTLEYLSIQPYTFYDGTTVGYWWSPIFESLQLTRLTKLICNGSMSDEIHSLVDFINLCPALETLVLGYHTLTFNQVAAHSLSTFHRLLSLDLKSLDADYSCFTTILTRFPALQDLTLTFASLPVNLEKYFHHISQLKHLTLEHITWIGDSDDGSRSIDDETTVTCFFQYLAAHSQLETIRLAQIPHFLADSLLAVACIPSLKSCDILLQETLNWNNALHKFALMLHGSVIEKLKLRTAGDVSFDALTALGDVPLLKELYLSSNSYCMTFCKVDEPGLLQLLRKAEGRVSVYFGGRVVVTKSGKEKAVYSDNLSMLINEAVPMYSVEKVNVQELLRPSRLDIKYYGTVIKRRANI